MKNILIEGTSQVHLLMAREKNILIEDTSQVHLLMAGKNILIEGTSQIHLLMAGEKHSHWRYKSNTPVNGWRKKFSLKVQVKYTC